MINEAYSGSNLRCHTCCVISELRTALRLFMTYNTQGVQVWQNTTDFLTFYRPQRSWGKVIFSQVCVILFTGGSASVHARIPPRPGTP